MRLAARRRTDGTTAQGGAYVDVAADRAKTLHRLQRHTRGRCDGVQFRSKMDGRKGTNIAYFIGPICPEAIMARHAEHQALALPMRPPRVPIHCWLYAEIRAAILNGRLASGQRLPPTRDLAHQFGIARGTAVAVFEQLAAEGYVTAAAGRGTHVASSLPDKLF